MGADDPARAEEVGLVDFEERLGALADEIGQRPQAEPAALLVELEEDLALDLEEAEAVDPPRAERLLGEVGGDHYAVRPPRGDLGLVPGHGDERQELARRAP